MFGGQRDADRYCLECRRKGRAARVQGRLHARGTGLPLAAAGMLRFPASERVLQEEKRHLVGGPDRDDEQDSAGLPERCHALGALLLSLSRSPLFGGRRVFTRLLTAWGRPRRSPQANIRRREAERMDRRSECRRAASRALRR